MNSKENILALIKRINESKAFDYKIYIQKVKSNLGKGYNLYFI